MKKVTLAVVLALALVFSTIGFASAITNGQPDGDNHPYVGLAVFDVLDQNGDPVPSHRCSASLLTPTIVLTAGHCTDGTAAARIWFDEIVQGNLNIPSAVQLPTMAFRTPIRAFVSGVVMACPVLPRVMSVSSS